MQIRLILCLVALAAPALNQTVQPAPARSIALNTLFKEVWEDNLKHTPEFASALGDRRYNDQLSDLSPKAFNDAVARHHDFLARLVAIDTTGLPEQDRFSATALQNQLIHDEEAARSKGWELPIAQTNGIQSDLPGVVAGFPFDNVKDYDDYIARLHKIPATLRQASQNLLSGIDDRRVQPASILQSALSQTEALANQAPEASPFALPFQRFPAAVSAAERKRISADVLEAIQTDVLPAYVRFAKFLKVVAIPAAPKDPSAAEIVVANSANALGFTPYEMEILELRAKLQGTLGPKFNLRLFHDIVLSSGLLPVGILEERVNAWIAIAK